VNRQPELTRSPDCLGTAAGDLPSGVPAPIGGTCSAMTPPRLPPLLRKPMLIVYGDLRLPGHGRRTGTPPAEGQSRLYPADDPNSAFHLRGAPLSTSRTHSTDFTACREISAFCAVIRGLDC
jgi:hypothetical protein